MPDKIDIEYYNIYFLTCDNQLIILCSKETQLDLSSKVIKVCKKYKNSNVNQEILNQFIEDGKGYVLYSVPNKNTDALRYWDMSMICVAIILIISIIFTKSKFLQKRTRLGKKIHELGDFDAIVEEINEDINTAIYKSGNVVVGTRYILMLSGKETEIIMMKEINSIGYEPDEKYPDDIIKIKIESIEDKIYEFDVYDEETAKKIVDHIVNH